MSPDAGKLRQTVIEGIEDHQQRRAPEESEAVGEPAGHRPLCVAGESHRQGNEAADQGEQRQFEVVTAPARSTGR